MRPLPLLAALVALTAALDAQPPLDSAALRQSTEQIRSAIGQWDVETEFLNPDGSVARAVRGTYEFTWVIPDRVASGRSDIPELGTSSAILFYINEAARTIEMVSVGADGRLWMMIGALGGEVRTTAPFATTDGGHGRLRFTRYNVEPDRFESRMEVTTDGGATWVPGNHQVFRRRR
jgi:hypothetical protein